jgi:hypothetical protein
MQSTADHCKASLIHVIETVVMGSTIIITGISN